MPQAYHRGTMTKTLITWSPALLWMGLLFFLSSLSHIPGERLFPFSDKVAHFGMFGMLGVALAWAAAGKRTGAETEGQGSVGSGAPNLTESRSEVGSGASETADAHLQPSGGRPRLGLLVVGALFAVSDEWHQSFVPHRDPSYGDLTADLAGLTLGYFLATALLRWIRTG